MLIRSLTLTLIIAFLTFGLGCPMQPAGPDGGGDGQTGDNDNGDGNGNGAIDVDGLIGSVNASVFRSINSAGDFNSVAAGAAFSTIEGPVGDSNVDTKTIGDCTVTTITIGDIGGDVPQIEPLDAGAEGMLSSGGRATETLTRLSEGVYSGPADLADRGYGAGQTFQFQFPGGADVVAFTASIEVPGELTVTSPDLTADDLTIDVGAALPIAWSATGTADGVNVVISTTNVSQIVTVSCTFDDAGSATVPEAAMECLIQNPLRTTISVNLTNTASVEVGLTSGGSGTVQATAQSGISRSLVAEVEGGSGFDACQFITCPDGQTCNAETFQCE